MNDGALKTAPSITARPTAEEKRLFAAIAAGRQMSESALALVAIRNDVQPAQPTKGPHPDVRHQRGLFRVLVLHTGVVRNAQLTGNGARGETRRFTRKSDASGKGDLVGFGREGFRRSIWHNV